VNNPMRLSIAVIGVLLLACGSKNSEKNLAARVGNAVLTKQALKQKIDDEKIPLDQENEYVEKWVNRELLALEARKLSLDRSSEFRDQLNTLGNELLIQKLLEKVFAEQIRLSDEEIASFYSKNKELFQVSEDEVHVLHILTKTQYDANQVLQEVRAGKAFEQIARERSVDSFRDKGGDLGFIKQTDVIPELARIAFFTPEGSISAIVKSTYGFHIVKVIKKYRIKDTLEFQDAKTDIIQRLRASKEKSVYMDLLYQLQNKYKVYVASAQGKNR
jgi:peptidyl-prolyl cis-trans isomerase C